MIETFRSPRDRSFVALGLSLMVACSGLLSATLPAVAGNPKLDRAHSLRPVKAASTPVPPHVANQMLVMVHNGADQTEVSDALKEADGKIVKTISNGTLNCYVIEVPPEKFNDSMKKLSKDKQHFDSVGYNALTPRTRKGGGSQGGANDPGFPQQYHLPLLNVPAAWAAGGNGRGVTIGIIDSGVIGGETDLFGRVDRGLNVITGGPGNTDPSVGFKHGTFCMTCAAATTNNHALGAAAAMNSLIIPVDVFNGAAFTADSDVMQGLFYLESRHVRLVNLSVNANPPFSFSNPAVHPALFAAFTDFFQNQNGLVFNAAGNSGLFCGDARTTSLIVISAINSTRTLAGFSNFGTPLWFTAPGVGIGSGDGANQFTFADGTSFSTPLALSVAAQIWGKNHRLTNAQVLQIMTSTASTNLTGYSQARYGFGLPDAGAALGH